jgi:rubrerythrin
MTAPMTVADVMNLAIKVEEVGSRVYGRLAVLFGPDQEVGRLFADLDQQERDHGEQFNLLFERLAPERERALTPEQEQRLRKQAFDEFFSPVDGLVWRLDEVVTPEDALRRALKLEETAVAYYTTLREVLPDPALDALVDLETHHAKMIGRQLELLAARQGGAGRAT